MSQVFGLGLTAIEPGLEDVLNTFARKLKISINCIKIGVIQSFDATTMTATVHLLDQQQMRDGSFQTVPPIEDVPVVTLQGAGYSFQTPIANGDTALVLFADGNIDNWYKTGGANPPADGRLHSMSDAIAIVGLNAKPNQLGYKLPGDRAGIASPDGSALVTVKNSSVMIQQNTTAQIELSGGLIAIRNASGSLFTILNAFLGACASATTVGQIASAAGTFQTALALLMQA